MAEDNNPKNVDEEILKENPDQTIAPPQLTLQEKPIPNPELKDNKKE